MPVGLSDEKVQAFDVSKPFTYQIEFDLPPQLTWRHPYKGLKVRPPQYSSQAVEAFLQLSAIASLIYCLKQMTFDAKCCGSIRHSQSAVFVQ